MTCAHDTRVIVLAKSPVPGRVKTRLVPPLTHDEAAHLAEAALADTLTAVSRSSAQRRVLVLDGPVGPWLPEGFQVVAQRGHGLAERLAAAWEDVGGPALQIGMDTPQVGPDLINDSLARLLTPGVSSVLGPAEDGGWWALGLHRAPAGLFSGMPFSTPHAGPAQAQRMSDLGLAPALLPTLRDVDEIDDVLAVADLVPGSSFAAATERLRGRLSSTPLTGRENDGAA